VSPIHVNWRRTCARLVASSAAGVPVWNDGGRYVSPTGLSSPHSIAQRPRVAARSAIGGVPLLAIKRAECGRETLIQSRRAARLSKRCRVMDFGVRLHSTEWPPNASSFPPVDRCARLERDLMKLFAPARSSPLAVAMRPRVAVRSSMSGAS
jgi:hypothetical protein